MSDKFEPRSGDGRRAQDRRKMLDPTYAGVERRTGVDRRATADRRRPA